MSEGKMPKVTTDLLEIEEDFFNYALKECGWKLALLKYRLIYEAFVLRGNFNEWLHCKRGYHKMSQCRIILTISKKKTKKTERIRTSYFKCAQCGLLRFLTVKQRQNYETIKKHETDGYERMIEDVRNHQKKRQKKKKAK